MRWNKNNKKKKRNKYSYLRILIRETKDFLRPNILVSITSMTRYFFVFRVAARKKNIK